MGWRAEKGIYIYIYIIFSYICSSRRPCYVTLTNLVIFIITGSFGHKSVQCSSQVEVDRGSALAVWTWRRSCSQSLGEREGLFFLVGLQSKKDGEHVRTWLRVLENCGIFGNELMPVASDFLFAGPTMRSRHFFSCAVLQGPRDIHIWPAPIHLGGQKGLLGLADSTEGEQS